MEVQAVSKSVRISPMKARDVARVLQGRPAQEALDMLELIPRKAARLLHKTLKSAMANAENNHNQPADLMLIKSARVEKGPVFKRFRPVARGSAHPYRKPTSHITIVLSDED
ncbi:MAG: 50S ribosomal protein L22 [Verrucomicrobiota bacterium]